MSTRRFATGCMIVAMVTGLAQPANAVDEARYDLQIKLAKAANDILHELQKRNVESVAVLKFREFYGHKDVKVSESRNLISSSISDQLTVALASIKQKTNTPVRVAAHANDVAMQTVGANHTTEQGRRALFGAEYDMFGASRSKVGAILSGVVQLSKDAKGISVMVTLAFPGSPFEPVAKFSALADSKVLQDCGRTFTLPHRGPSRDIFPEDAGLVGPPEAVEIEMDILYDGKSVVGANSPTVDGVTYIAEPDEHQKVSLRLRRTDRLPTKVGVVVTVNGENVIGRDRLNNWQSRKIIMTRDDGLIGIPGMWGPDNETLHPFKVASEPRSREWELYYGREVGMIQMVVYQAVEVPVTPLQTTPLAADGIETTLQMGEESVLRSIAFGELARDANDSNAAIGALETLARSMGDIGSRGVIAPAMRAKKKKLRITEKLEWNPLPIGSAVYRYRETTQNN